MEEGLIVPAIPQADRLGLEKIAQMRADLVDRARIRKLKLEEIERGTFTISSLAQFDIIFLHSHPQSTPEWHLERWKNLGTTLSERWSGGSEENSPVWSLRGPSDH